MRCREPELQRTDASEVRLMIVRVGGCEGVGTCRVAPAELQHGVEGQRADVPPRRQRFVDRVPGSDKLTMYPLDMGFATLHEREDELQRGPR